MTKETITYNQESYDFLDIFEEDELKYNDVQKLPLSDFMALGVAFQPITSMIQTAITGEGGSGIYYVNTMGKKMFTKNGTNNFIGALKNAAGKVGGGQAQLTQLPCDPTMLCLAAALVNIEKKLDEIKAMQQDIMDYLKEKEKAALKSRYQILSETMEGYKYNVDNKEFKQSHHVQILEIKTKSAESMDFHKNSIEKIFQKKKGIHLNRDVKKELDSLVENFRNYQMSLYTYAYAYYLDVLLGENYNTEYLNLVLSNINKYSISYKNLYTDCYDLIEHYSKTSIESEMLDGISGFSKFMGEKIAQVPIINKTQIDENLVMAGDKLKEFNKDKINKALEELIRKNNSMVYPFVENIKILDSLHNKETIYIFDEKNVYIKQCEKTVIKTN